MIWTQNDADDFIRRAAPPGVVPGSYSEKIPFVEFLAIAIDSEIGGELLLEALRKKYPEAVETYMPEAERRLQEAILAVRA